MFVGCDFAQHRVCSGRFRTQSIRLDPVSLKAPAKVWRPKLRTFIEPAGAYWEMTRAAIARHSV
jgi:hypothetical protein